MRPVSDAFLHALRGSHSVATRCLLTFPGESEPVQVPIEAGSVTIDRTAMVRRTGQVVIPWSLRVGLDLGLDLRTLPLGGYCHLYRGVRFATDSELCLLGTFRVESVTWRTSDESAALELADRMAQVRDEPFLSPYTPVVLTPVTRSGTLTDDSPIITGLATTSDLLVGMIVTAPGVFPGTKIASIDSPSQVTLTRAVNIHAFKSTTGLGDSDLISVETTSDLFVGMAMSGAVWTSGMVVTEIVSSTQARTNAYWAHSGPWGGNVTYTLPASQSITFAGTVLIADAALEITQAVFGDTINYAKLYEPAVVLGDVYYAGSRGDALQALALAASADVYFDANGDWYFDHPAGATDPVWRVDAAADGVMVGADESLARTGVYNGVLVQGQNTATDAPVTALVTHDDPTSPTRWGGPFGRVARVEQSSSVQTIEQATATAQSLLDQRLTLQRSLSVTAAPNPALEAGDVITVAFPDGREEDHVIDVVRIGLAPADAQTFALRGVVPPDATQLTPRRRYGVYAGAAAWREANRARLVAA